MRKVLVGLILLSGLASGDEVPQGNPAIQAGTFKGHASFVPWSGIWWPMVEGKLGIGWNGSKSYTYDSAAKKYVFNPSVATKDLSPFAKYDKFAGNAPDNGAAIYELTVQDDWFHHIYGDKKAELDKDGVDYSWWGHCNGWSGAALMEDEPVCSIDAKGIRFEVADLKGLLTESYFGVVSDFSGTRYEKPSDDAKASFTKAKDLLAKLSGTPPAASVYRAWYEKAFDTKLSQDYTPAAYKGVLEYYIKYYTETYVDSFANIRPDVFHKILTTVIGQQKGGVVFDISADEAVWNYPAFAYETTIVDKGTKPIGGVTRRVFEVTTMVTYADDGVSESILGTRTFTKTYTYELYTTLYAKKLKGGKWTGESVDDHPDFAWMPKVNPKGKDDDENAKLLYGTILDILPVHHEANEVRPFQLFANGVGSESLRTADESVTYWNPVTTSAKVTFSYETSLTTVATVKYFEQKVAKSGNIVKAKRDPLVPLGQGVTATATLASGTHMIVAYAYDAQGRLQAVDEVTVKIQ